VCIQLRTDEEVQGGKISLIAFKQMRAQKPRNGLDRMQSAFLKQVAYNQRVIEAEDEVAGINCDIADFLSEMTLNPEEPVIICVNGSEEMKRNEEAIGGQLWMQSWRQMTASNRVKDGMANSRDSAILSAAAEAVEWRHAWELDGPRKGQRVVIYPKDLPQLGEVLNAGDPNIDRVDGNPIAYTAILQASQSFENPPIFLKEDSEQITSNPELAEKVPEWMSLATQVSTGSRRRVLENGPDKMKSDEEDDEKMVPDEEPNMYAPGMDPSKGPIKLSPSQVAAQKAAAKALKNSKVPPRSQSPANGSSDEDDPNGSEYIWSSSKGYFRKNKHWKGATVTSVPALPASEPHKALPAPELKALPAPKPQKAPPAPELKMLPAPEPAPRTPTPINSDEDDLSEDQKRAVALGKRMSKKGTTQGTSRTKPTTEAQASHPMATRKTASRAGGLRSGGGLGQTDTCVVAYNPSKT
jgi:hypothetical protein